MTTAPRHPAPTPAHPPAPFDPGAALAALDFMTARCPTLEASRAWDAAWIACLTSSPRWVEAARRDFIAAVAGAASNGR